MQQGWLWSGWIIFSCAIFFSVLSSSFSDAGLIDGSVDQEDIHDDDSSSSSSSSAKNYNWWTSMFQGLPGQPNIAQPANRRGHSATYFIDDQSTEWMIVSGGFTDKDWHSMPVWAYDLTTGKEMEHHNNDMNDMLDKWDVADEEMEL